MDGQEPDYQKTFKQWSANPTPQSTGQFLKQLDPVIQRGVNSFAGGKNDPLMRSRARQLTLTALRSYDPNQGAKLTTHITNNLQGLRRIARRQQQILKTPDRVAMEQAFLHNSQLELNDQLGREPSTAELADYTRLSAAKIARLRRYMPGVAEGMLEEGQSEQFTGRPVDRTRQMAMALHGDLEPRDQQILEWSLGLYGNQRMSNNEIAQRLKVSPGAVSQRKARIQQQLELLLSHL